MLHDRQTVGMDWFTKMTHLEHAPVIPAQEQEMFPSSERTPEFPLTIHSIRLTHLPAMRARPAAQPADVVPLDVEVIDEELVVGLVVEEDVDDDDDLLELDVEATVPPLVVVGPVGDGG